VIEPFSWQLLRPLFFRCALSLDTYERKDTPEMGRRRNPPTRVQPLLLTIPEVSLALGLGRTKVYELIRKEGLPTVKLGTATRVRLTSLQQWLEQREQIIA